MDLLCCCGQLFLAPSKTPLASCKALGRGTASGRVRGPRRNGLSLGRVLTGLLGRGRSRRKTRPACYSERRDLRQEPARRGPVQLRCLAPYRTTLPDAIDAQAAIYSRTRDTHRRPARSSHNGDKVPKMPKVIHRAPEARRVRGSLVTFVCVLYLRGKMGGRGEGRAGGCRVRRVCRVGSSSAVLLARLSRAAR